MSKVCGKCDKQVYPTEELKCLDKVWHKGCFRCWECNTSLNMKNYKGFDKKPYCNAHYPSIKATVVGSDTPENRRLAQNTKQQSQVKYHEEFEKSIKGSKITVADDPETARIRQVTNVVSQVEYKGIKGEGMRYSSRPPPGAVNVNPMGEQQRYSGEQQRYSGQDQGAAINHGHVPQHQEYQASPYSAKSQSSSTTYTSAGDKEVAVERGRVGSISDYDPVNEQFGSIGSGYKPRSSAYETQEWEETIPEPRANQPPPHAVQGEMMPPPSGGYGEPQYPPPLQHGMPCVPANQPVALNIHSYSEAPQQHQQQRQQPMQQQQQQRQPVQQYNPPPQQVPAPPQEPPNPLAGMRFQAMYDYEAADADEVSFQDGDILVNCQAIDEGWMYGTVQRTGKMGMLPSNYVERAK